MADERRGDGGWRDEHERGGDRSFFERAGDELRSWLGDEDGWPTRGRGDYADSHSRSYGGSSGRESRQQIGFDHRGDHARSNQGSSMDDHYRSWRDRQVAELDRDYEAYCRERQQQFHSDFDQWRQTRQTNRQSDQEQSGTSSERDGSVPPTFGFPGASASTGSSGSAHPSDGVTAGGGDDQAGSKRSTSRSNRSKM